MKNKNLKLYAGVSIMTMALLIHMTMNLSNNTKTREVAINDFKQITSFKDLEENKTDSKKKGR